MTSKIIYTTTKKNRDNTRNCCVYLLVGYNQGFIQDFLEMMAEMKKDFPQVALSNTTCGKIHTRHCCDGHSFVRSNLRLTDEEIRIANKKGWRVDDIKSKEFSHA